MSYQIGVLGKRGWVERRRAECDGRGWEAVLSEQGARAFRNLRPAHARDVREIFFFALQGDDAARLTDIMRRVAQRQEKKEIPMCFDPRAGQSAWSPQA